MIRPREAKPFTAEDPGATDIPNMEQAAAPCRPSKPIIQISESQHLKREPGSIFLRMRTLSIAIAAMLILLVSRAQADLPRHPLSGPPRTARGVVERFLLLQKQLMLHQGEGALNGIVAIQGGVLMPVSEDRDGIYYQNPNGVWVRDLNSTSLLPLGGILYPGGLWFSKTDPNKVYAYTGDARKPKQYLEREWRSISPRALAALKVGHVAKPTTKKSR